MTVILLFLLLSALLCPGFLKGMLQLIFFGILALGLAVADHATLIGYGFVAFAAITILGGVAHRLTGKR